MSRSCFHDLLLGRRTFSVLRTLENLIQVLQLCCLQQLKNRLSFAVASGCICGFLPYFEWFWEGLWIIAPLYSHKFSHPGSRPRSPPHSDMAACCLCDLSCGNKNCRLTLLFAQFLFTVPFFPFSFLVCCRELA